MVFVFIEAFGKGMSWLFLPLDMDKMGSLTLVGQLI